MAITKVTRTLLSTGIDDQSNATAITIDSSENVGIGNDSPSSYYATELVIDASDEGGISVVNETTEAGYLAFADGTSGTARYSGYLSYDHDVDALTSRSAGYINFMTGGGTERMRIDSSGAVLFKSGAFPTNQDSPFIYRIGGGSLAIGAATETGTSAHAAFYTNSLERMRIDSSGNLLVGTTNTAPGAGNTNAGVAIRGGSDNRSFFSVSSNYVAAFNRNTTDGNILEFNKDGSPVGSISTAYSGSRLAIGKDGHGLGFVPTSAAIIPHSMTTNQNSNGTTDLGTDGVAFRNLYLSGGVVFDAVAGNATSNTLDDYEEGTWTPTVASGTGGFIGTPEGVYVKVGNIVHVKAVFYVDVNFSSNAIGGLPFTVADDITASVFGWNGAVVCETTGINCSAPESDTVINFFNEGDTGSNHNPSTTGSLYRVSVTYKST